MAVDHAARRLVLVAAVMGSFVALLDSTVVNVALPAIEDDLGGGLAAQQWVVNGYLLMLGSLILVGGSLGDVLGERRMFVIGVGGFGLASVLCAAAPTVEFLVAARVLQGVFGALLTPAALALIVAAFPADTRGAAIGTWTAYVGIAAVVGPLAGGLIVDATSWRWVFGVNVPFVAITLLLLARIPPVGTIGPRRRVDLVGAALCAVGLAGPVFGLIQQPDRGWGDPLVALPILLGLAVFGAFLAWERRHPDPMLPLGLFGRGNFAWGNAETFAVYAGLGALFFVLVVFLQQAGGLSALEAGLATLPTTIVMFLIARRVGALADERGPRLFMGTGPLVAAVGVVVVALSIDADANLVTEVLPGMLIFAVGLSLTVSPLTAAVLADADQRDAGIASGVNNAVARVAGLLAVAAVGAVAGGDLDVGSLRTVLGFVAALLAAGGIIGFARIRDPRRELNACDCPGGQLAGAPKEAGYAAAVTGDGDGARDGAGADGALREGAPRAKAGGAISR